MPATDHYDALYQSFRWMIPEDCNIAQLCCGRWSDDPERIAIVVDDPLNGHREVSYANLQRDANRLSHVLHSLGV